MCMFIILPLMMMSAFTYLHDQLVGKFLPEQHNFKRKSVFDIYDFIKPTLQPKCLFCRFNLDKREYCLALFHGVRYEKQPTELA